MIVTVSRWGQDPVVKESDWRFHFDQHGVCCVHHAVVLFLHDGKITDAVISGNMLAESPVVEVSSRLKCARWRFEEKK